VQYTLGDYTLDTQRYELCRTGMPLKLQPKIFDLLVYLLQHRHRVVTRQELFDILWPEHFVSDDALEWIIAAARRAVGDTGRAQRVIKTIRSRGYRWVAPIEERPHVLFDDALLAVSTNAHEAENSSAVLPPVQGERKQATVLAGTLSSLGTSVAGLDPETLHTARQYFFALAQQEVQRYEGTIQHFIDNAFLAFFGTPIAQEDHARRAVLAALRIQAGMRHPNAALMLETGREWVASISMHTGEVIVGPIGAAPRQIALAVGDILQVADQLLRLAEPGAIVLSAVARRPVQGFLRLDRVEPVNVPGAMASPPVYKVLGLASHQPALGWQGRRVVRQFVGRKREMGTLHALLTQVKDGRGQVVGIAGEPGIGKSRFLYEFRQQMRHTSCTYLAGRCVSYGQATPYLPLLDLVRQACGLTERDTLDEMTAKVGQYLQDVGMEAEAWSPYVFRLLGIEDGTGHLSLLSPQALRARIFETLIQMQLSSSRQGTLLLEVEDVHWIDPTSEEWLMALIERLAGVPILLLLSYRSGYQPAWMAKSYATQLALQRLTADESQRVVHAILTHRLIPDVLMQAIVAKGQGNPFFLEELAQVVVEQGELYPALVIPETVQAVLAARLDRLPPEAKTLLQVASVIGAEVSGSLLQAVTTLSAPLLHQHLVRLQEAELLYEARAVPAPVYTFKHVLTQEVAYHSLLRSTRQQYHQQIAEMLVRQFPDMVETQPEVLAHHFTEAGLYQQAVYYWHQAGEGASERSAYVEASAHLTRGLEVLSRLPDTCARTAQELQLQLALHVPLAAVEGHGSLAHEHTLHRAQELSQRVGTPQQQIQLLGALATIYWRRHDLQPARTLSEQLLALALEVRDARGCRWGHQNLGYILYHLGELAAAQSHLTQALTFYSPQQSPLGADMTEPRVFPLTIGALVLWTRGYPDQALKHLHQALAIAHEVTHPYSLGIALCYAAMLHSHRCEWQTAQAYVDALLTLGADHDLQYLVTVATWLRGAALVGQGHLAEGMTQLRQWWAVNQGREQPEPFRLSLLAEAYGEVGQAQEGLAMVEEALAKVHPTGKRVFLPRLYWLKSKLLLALSVEHRTEAATCLHHALAIARQQESKMWELRAAVSLSRLLQRQGKRAVARQLLAEVYNWFTEGFDTSDLQEAKILLRQLSSTP
jgi:DNA-binding winged helix-turn-helix (wHTH) protein/tetratricopeptide (TPR) repeat protein